MPKEALMIILVRRVMRTLGGLRCVVSLLQDQVSLEQRGPLFFGKRMLAPIS